MSACLNLLLITCARNSVRSLYLLLSRWLGSFKRVLCLGRCIIKLACVVFLITDINC